MIVSNPFKRRMILTAIGWFVSFLLAWPIAGAFRSIVMCHAGDSLSLGQLNSSWDMSFWLDLLLNSSDAALFPWVLFWGVGVWLVFQPGFTAWVMRNRQRPDDPLMSHATYAFSRWPGMVVISLVYTVLAGIVLVLFGLVVGLLVTAFESSPSQEMMPVGLSLLAAGFVSVVILALIAPRLMTSALYARGECLRVAFCAPLTAGWGYWGRMLARTFGLLLAGGLVSYGLSIVTIFKAENPIFIQSFMQLAVIIHVLCRVLLMEMYAGNPPALRIRVSQQVPVQTLASGMEPVSFSESSDGSDEGPSVNGVTPSEAETPQTPLPDSCPNERIMTEPRDFSVKAENVVDAPPRVGDDGPPEAVVR